MDHILKAAWFEHRCNACGGSYRVSLYDVLQEARLGRDWVSARPSDACHADFDSYIAAIPGEALEALDAAWTGFTGRIPPSLTITIAPAPEAERARP